MSFWFYYGYGADMNYWLLVLISLVLGLATQGYIRHTYRKWSKVNSRTGKTGADVAEEMLRAGGAGDVGITRVDGTLTDYYDPRDNMLHLSNENFTQGSVASVAVACHEAGHAVQHAQGYAPMKVRSALTPVVNFASNAWMVLFFLGVFMDVTGLVQFAILLFAISVIFELVTLPVEINASQRAVTYLSQNGGAIDERGARQVLTAAALTYVAAALVSILQLLYLTGTTNDER